MVIGQNGCARSLDIETGSDEVDEPQSVKLPVGTDDEALRGAIIEHATAGPFLVFGPDRRGRQSIRAQRGCTTTSQSGPVLEMAGIDGQHIAIGVGALQRDGERDDGRFPSIFDNPERTDHPALC